MRKIPILLDVCHYCGAPAPTTRDHIVPLALGGPNTARNVVPCCEACNQAKGMTKPTCRCEQCVAAVALWWPLNPDEHLTQRIQIPGYELGSDSWT